MSRSLYPKEIVADQPERFFVTELIREKIFELYSQEIPYGCQVGRQLAGARRQEEL